VLVPHGAALNALRADARVLQIDEDQPLDAIGKTPPPPPDAGVPPPQPDQVFSTGYKIVTMQGTPPNEGTDIPIAILDTGIDLTHPDLQANIDLVHAKDCVKEPGGVYVDNHGHGTHVAGIAAALDNGIGVKGVASEAKISPVKVVNRKGSGSWSTIICGIDHVTANAEYFKVANMSLGGPGTECNPAVTACHKSALQVAVERSVAAGVTYVVAAGNENDDAANHVPAAFDAVITVSGYVSDDGEFEMDGNGDFIHDTDTGGFDEGWPYYSNYGADVDIGAPAGANNYVSAPLPGIYSTNKGGTYAYRNGTSMASPHVAAAAAIVVKACQPLVATPDQIRGEILSKAMDKFHRWGVNTDKHPENLLSVVGLGCPPGALRHAGP
jgi:subtilisin family serine protease